MVVLMVVVEVLDDRVKRPEDIEELMGLTCLVLCQILRNCRLGDRMNTLEISKTNYKKFRKAEEYFNALATNIQLSGWT